MSKISKEVGRIDNFRALVTTLCTYSVYLSTSNLLSFIICNTKKHEFGSIWESINCCNDVMNHVDCVIKRDVYPLKMHSIFFVLKISVVY